MINVIDGITPQPLKMIGQQTCGPQEQMSRIVNPPFHIHLGALCEDRKIPSQKFVLISLGSTLPTSSSSIGDRDIQLKSHLFLDSGQVLCLIFILNARHLKRDNLSSSFPARLSRIFLRQITSTVKGFISAGQSRTVTSLLKTGSDSWRHQYRGWHQKSWIAAKLYERALM